MSIDLPSCTIMPYVTWLKNSQKSWLTSYVYASFASIISIVVDNCMSFIGMNSEDVFDVVQAHRKIWCISALHFSESRITLHKTVPSDWPALIVDVKHSLPLLEGILVIRAHQLTLHTNIWFNSVNPGWIVTFDIVDCYPISMLIMYKHFSLLLWFIWHY